MDHTIKLAQEPPACRDMRALRHKWEQPIFLTASAITLAVVLSALFLLLLQFFSPEDWNLIPAENQESVYLILLLVLVAPFAALLWRKTQVAKQHISGITVSSTQLPDVQELLLYYCRMAGVRHVPTVIVVAGAKPSSLTSAGWRHHTITLSNLLVEVKTPDGDRQALRYALAREVGHIAAGHCRLTRQLLTVVTQSIPYISAVLYHAEAYTADRWAALLAPDCAATYYGVEATGKFLWTDLAMEEITARAGSGGVLEIMSAYLLPVPPITWRVEAIAKTGIFKIFAGAGCQTETDHSMVAACKSLKEGSRMDTSALNLQGKHGALWLPPRPQKARDIEN